MDEIGFLVTMLVACLLMTARNVGSVFMNNLFY